MAFFGSAYGKAATEMLKQLAEKSAAEKPAEQTAEPGQYKAPFGGVGEAFVSTMKDLSARSQAEELANRNKSNGQGYQIPFGRVGEEVVNSMVNMVLKSNAENAASKGQEAAASSAPVAAPSASQKATIADDDPRLARSQMLNLDNLVKAGVMTPLTQRMLANDPSKISDREYRNIVKTALANGMPESDLFLSGDNEAFISGYANARNGA